MITMKTLNINSNLFKTKHRNFKRNQFLQIIFTVIPRNHVNGIISIISEVHLLFQCVDYLMVFNSSQTGVMYSLWGHSVLVVSRKINIQEPKQEYGIQNPYGFSFISLLFFCSDLPKVRENFLKIESIYMYIVLFHMSFPLTTSIEIT